MSTKLRFSLSLCFIHSMLIMTKVILLNRWYNFPNWKQCTDLFSSIVLLKATFIMYKLMQSIFNIRLNYITF